MVRIVHFSDWHGEVIQLPPADLYVCTGDMLPNDPRRRRIEAGAEAAYQERWVQKNAGCYRKESFGDPGAPAVYVRGNHDFVGYAGLFDGDVTEITLDPTVTHEVLGLRIGGFRGVPWIHGGYWSDEMFQERLQEQVDGLPLDLDVLVTHCPPNGILDNEHERYGSKQLSRWFNEKYGLSYIVPPGIAPRRAPRLHCFGHIHESFGEHVEEGMGTTFSNAATFYRTIDL